MSESEKNKADQVAEANVERLLRGAYRPEMPEGAFMEQVRAAMLARREDVMDMQALKKSRDRVVFTIRALSAWSAVAAVLIVVLTMALVMRKTPLQVGKGEDRPKSQTAAAAGVAVAEEDLGLTPRAREEKVAAEKVAIGQTITTKAGEKRRLVLPDFSVLYVNEKSSVKLEGERRVALNSGEVFVEVSPREAGSGDAATFLVKTPKREVSAYGTKFSVKADGGGTGVMVTQGKVKVSGVDGVIKAGQQVEAAKSAPEAAPKATAALEWTRELVEASQTPLVPDSKYQGGALVVVDPWGQESRLSLRKYHIDVHIEDGFARTTIDQTYFNHENRRQEGTFYFPLPADASLSRLAMYVDGKLMEGGMAERDYARNVYESIVYQQKDPALLEWVDGTTFKMRVFPLEPRQEKRVILSYTQRLAEQYSQAEYRFPTGHSMQLVNAFSFHATVKNGLNTQWASELVGMESRISGKDLLIDFKAENVKPDRDVVVHLTDPLHGPMMEQARFSATSAEGGQYFMVRFKPNLPSIPVRERRDWVFLFESSGARDPLLARAQVDIVRTMLENAEHDDTFSIVTAGTRASVLMPAALAATPENVKSAIKMLEKTHLVGALDMGGAMEAVKPLVSAGKNPWIVHVGTGQATLGERRSDLLVAKLPGNAHYVGVAVGKNWNRGFMKAAASRTGGYYTQINPDEPIVWRAMDLLATLNTPRLLDVHVKDNVGNSYLLFEDSVAQGQELAAATRSNGAAMPKEVTISGTLDGKPYEKKLSVEGVGGDAGYLPRMWAKLEIDRLLAENAGQNKARVVELSKAMYVMSPFTSLLVLENEEMYKRFNVDRGRKDHWAMYPAPEKIEVKVELDPNNPLPAKAGDLDGRRLPAEQVMETILVRMPARGLYWPGDNNGYYGGQGLTAFQAISGDWGDNQWAMEGFEDGLLGDHWFRGDVSGRGRMNLWSYRNGVFEKDKKLAPLSAVSRHGLREESEVGRRAGGKYMMDRLKAVKGFESRDGASLFAAAKLGYLGRGGFGGGGGFGGRMNTWRGPGGAPMGSELAAVGGRITSTSSPVPALRPMARFDKDSISKRLPARKREEAAGEELASRIGYGYGAQANFTYQRPYFSGDYRVFGDLLSYAPGMNTSDADIAAVLDEEAVADASQMPGKVAEEARKLIEAARGIGWQTATIPGNDGQEGYSVTFDGQGRFAMERTLSTGLRERVVCDGKTLYHLYPELGVAARRNYSRSYLAELSAMAPMVLGSADDLARGCDLSMAGPRTVAIDPRDVGQAKDEKGKPVEWQRVELVFADDGTLAERRAVDMPSGKVVYRESYGKDGTVRVVDGEGKELRKTEISLKPATAPSLVADTKDLVVLSLPYRTREYWVARGNLKMDDNSFATWSDADALNMAAADMSTSAWEMFRILAAKFLSKGDRRIGFYMMLISGGQSWDVKQAQNPGVNLNLTLDPTKDYPNSPLAAYIADQLLFMQRGYNNVDVKAGKMGGTFVDQMSTLRYLYTQWQTGKWNQGDEEHRNRERRLAIDFIKSVKDPVMGWSALTMVINQGGGDAGFWQEMAEAVGRFEKVEGLSYAARYELARFTGNSGHWDEARTLYRALHDETLKQGKLPAIDYDFRNAFRSNGNAKPEEFAQMMRETQAELMKKHGPAAGVYVAWQCYQLSEQALAEELFSVATTNVPDDQRLMTALTGIDYLWNTSQAPRADAMLAPLLADKKFAEYPELWRLEAAISGGRGMLARSLACQERALDMEYKSLPALVNVQAIREDYGSLLAKYQQLADAITTLQNEAPKDFVARVVRAADRWRALDPDATGACQSAARVLYRLGNQELAWDYLTTPLAEHSNEAGPWATLALALRQQGDFELADRAYATAFQVEPTNAQVLWDRAMLLQQSQKFEEARKLFKQLADGKWEPRFSWIQRQAKNYDQSR